MYKTCSIAQARKLVGKEVKVAGWVHETRNLGKLRFLQLRDQTGIIQLTAKAQRESDEVLAAMDLPKETVICAEGKVVESSIAEAGCELIPSKITVLNQVKSKLPIDVTEHVPAELDVRLDYRYIDLRRPKTRAIFAIRSRLAQAFREKCQLMGAIELHPPTIVGAATEGGAELFRVEYFEKEAFLVQSPQLYKQLAIIGGLDKVYMTVPVFRAEKHNTMTHLNEAYQMDMEIGFADAKDAVDALEEVVLYVLAKVKKECEEELKILQRELKIPSSIPRHTYSFLVEKLQSEGIEFRWGEDFSRAIEEKISEILGYSTYFILEWPSDIRPFYSMPDKTNPKICHAYDLNYEGLEISSGAQRVHDAEMLVEQLRKRGLKPADFEFYINAFRSGAPPHAGWSIGLDRLTMKVCGLHNIREAVLFPRDRVRIRP
ncbi:MAG: aspartate--tRNA(Asn) ligase [Candidatus Micrarchaeota archaeon]|nr:aspartate--tRNA(Asn) ligase [Candidatus Micrarchaeota archaeon]